MRAYRVHKKGSIDHLTLQKEEMPKPCRGQVLVRIRATSLNFRDLFMLKGNYPGSQFPLDGGTIPLSDCAGEVTEVGEGVECFKKGDRVYASFFQKWVGGKLQEWHLNYELGGSVQGVLAEYRVFDECGLIHMPCNLSYEEGATLPCAAVTAWHALFCNRNPVGPGQTVLVEGTGGVAMFALQFALAAGAKVIVISSCDKKLKCARECGSIQCINYKENPEWNEEVLKLTNGRGVDHVVDIGGSGTLQRAIESTAIGGNVHIIGFLSKESRNVEQKKDICAEGEYFDPCKPLVWRSVNLHGLKVGSREMAESMNRAIEAHKLHPIIDKVFPFEKAKDAYRYFSEGKHIGKVVIRMDEDCESEEKP